MKFNLQQEDAMGAKAKTGVVRGAARKHAANAARTRRRRAATAPAAWEQSAQAADERGHEFDCQRIVEGEGGRSLPLYYDDYN